MSSSKEYDDAGEDGVGVVEDSKEVQHDIEAISSILETARARFAQLQALTEGDDKEETDEEIIARLKAEVADLKRGPRVGVAVFILSPDHPNRFIVGTRKGSHGAGTVALPGGHLEYSEEWAQCASRELEEETELHVDPSAFQLVGTSNDVFADDNKHYITIFMCATLPSGAEPIVTEPHKCEAWSWMTIDELRRCKLFVPMRNFLASDNLQSTLARLMREV